jgi:nucleotide-binding universal stress UspA family protein
MFQTILVPTDGSPLSRQAEDAAIEFARRNGATLVAFSVAEPEPDAAAAAGSIVGAALADMAELVAAAQLRVRGLVDRAQAADIPCQCSVAVSYHPHEEILKAASDYQCDVIFMASHGSRGFQGIVLGRETQAVLVRAKMPVMVFR